MNADIRALCTGKEVKRLAMYQRKSDLQDLFLLLVDFICVTAGLAIANYVRHGRAFNLPFNELRFVYLWGMCEGVFLIVNLMFRINKDFYIRGLFREFLVVFGNNLVILLGATFILYFLKLSASSSRLMLLLFVGIDTVLMLVVHQVIKLFLPVIYRRFSDLTRLLLVADHAYANSAITDIKASADFSEELIGIVIPDRPELKEYQGVPVVSDMDHLADYCRRGSLDEVIIAIDEHNRERAGRMKSIMEDLAQMGLIIHYRIELPDLNGTRHKMLLRKGRMYTVTYASQITSVGQVVLKRVMDIAGGIVGCVIAGLLFVILGPIIKIQSPGPIIFKQKRVGRNGRVFNMYKFRSMYVDAEERKKELMDQNEMSGLMFKMVKDPRITPIGRFMRRTSLDEFPQFYNILCGEMSLVGTRPPTLDEFSKYSYSHKKRLSFRPGLTGLWQVSGRNEITDFDEIVRLDVEYIDNWTILLDIKILFKTLGVAFTGR